VELLPDSGGAGKHRGGLGVQMNFQMLEDAYVTAVIERTKSPGWGLEGGEEAGIPNSGALRKADGSRTVFGKATRLLVRKGETLELTMGGGGGYGPPSERDPEAVLADIREGYITEAKAREKYPHAFA
jgi:N-methylhydantoinase B